MFCCKATNVTVVLLLQEPGGCGFLVVEGPTCLCYTGAGSGSTYTLNKQGPQKILSVNLEIKEHL